MMQVEVSDQKLMNFQPKMEASTCYLEVDDHILLIQQGKDKTDEGQWGVPAGKLEQRETSEIAAKRELFEETGIQLRSFSQFVYLGTLYIRKSDLDYVYYMFKIQLDHKPPIQLSIEHSNYRWAEDIPFAFLITSPEVNDAITLDLFICNLNYLGKRLICAYDSRVLDYPFFPCKESADRS